MLLTIILIIGLIAPFIAIRFIKPDGRYHCHLPGCNKSFDTLGELELHLYKEHNLTIDWSQYE